MAGEAFLQAGGCRCGTLRYTVTKPPLGIYACHCTDCQTLSGSAFGMGVIVPAAAFSLTGWPRRVERVLGSGAVAQRLVCPKCAVWVCGGTTLDGEASADAPSDEVQVVRAGTFDDTSWIRPAVHYWTKSAQPWIVFPDGVETHATEPQLTSA